MIAATSPPKKVRDSEILVEAVGELSVVLVFADEGAMLAGLLLIEVGVGPLLPDVTLAKSISTLIRRH